MSVFEVPKEEQTKDKRKWVYEIKINGKRHKSKKYRTRSEAEVAAKEFYEGIKKKENRTIETLGDLFKEHYNHQIGNVKKTTLSNYEKKIKHFNSIKDVTLDKFDADTVKEWKEEMNRKNLEVGTKNDILKYFKSALNYGREWHDLDFSKVYSKMEKFKNPDEVPKEMNYYTYEEFKKFINAEKDLKYKTLFETLYYCGVRRGELRGLTWDNVYLNEKEIYIKKNVVNISGDSGKWSITSPKTQSSIRKIPIPNVLVRDLTAYKEMVKKYYGFSDNWFVFGDMTPIHPETIRVRKNDIAKKAGLKEIRIHDFRHSCASLLINNGANITIVSKYLGHSKIEQTLGTYFHLFKNTLDSVVDTINKLEQ